MNIAEEMVNGHWYAIRAIDNIAYGIFRDGIVEAYAYTRMQAREILAMTISWDLALD